MIPCSLKSPYVDMLAAKAIVTEVILNIVLTGKNWCEGDVICQHCLQYDRLNARQQSKLSLIIIKDRDICEKIRKGRDACLWFSSQDKVLTSHNQVFVTCPPPEKANKEVTTRLTLLWNVYSHAVNIVHLICRVSWSKRSVQGRHLQISTVEICPYIIKSVIGNTVSFSGIYIDVLDVLASKFNFSYSLSEPDDQAFGTLREGKWTGLIGQLVRREIDMVVGPLSIDHQRFNAISFTVPLKMEHTAVIAKLPDQSSPSLEELVKLFPFHVILTVGAAFVFASVFMFILKERKTSSKTVLDASIRLLNICICYFGILFRTTLQYRLNDTSCRISLGSWVFFSLLMSTLYTTSLVSFLTVSRQELPFTSLKELVEQDHAYTFGIIGQGSNIAVFENSSNDIYRKLYHRLKTSSVSDPDVLSTDMNIHREKLKRGNYAFLGSNMVLQRWKRELCNMMILEERSIVQYYAFGLQLDSDLTDIISSGLLRMTESGVIANIEERWRPTSLPCEIGTHLNKSSFSLSRLNFVFIIAGIGTVFSTLVLACEMCIKRTCRLPITCTCDDNPLQC